MAILSDIFNGANNYLNTIGRQGLGGLFSSSDPFGYLGQQISAFPQLLNPGLIHQPNNGITFSTPPGWSAPGYINGSPARDYASSPAYMAAEENTLQGQERALRALGQDNGAGMGMYNPAQDAMSKIQNSYTKLINDAKTQAANYESANPFKFDDYLAGKATDQAHATLDPYYNQQLGYYLSGVTNKINRSQTDLQDTLKDLQTSASDYSKQSEITSASNLVNTNQQNESSGLGSSGRNFSEQGQQQASSGADLSAYLNQNLNKQTLAQHQTGFDIADILNSSNAQQQALRQENITGVNNLATNLAKNAQQSWLAGLYSQPAITSLSGMGGGFDITKALGING